MYISYKNIIFVQKTSTHYVDFDDFVKTYYNAENKFITI
jgi:hypothetical protein